MKPIAALCMTGWGQSESRFRNVANTSVLRSYGIPNIHVLQPPRPIPNWFTRDWKWISEKVRNLSETNRVLLTGFSDSALPALLTALYNPLDIEWFVFHSGRFRERDLSWLPCMDCLVIAGLNDWTANWYVPFRTRATELYDFWKRVNLHVDFWGHLDGHCWLESHTRYVGQWIQNNQ